MVTVCLVDSTIFTLKELLGELAGEGVEGVVKAKSVRSDASTCCRS